MNRATTPADSAEEWRSLYPFASHEISLDGHRYHYLDEGRGEPILFVHGNPTWSFYWRNLILGLRDNYRCLAPDHLGCGLSDKPLDYPYELERHIVNLTRFVESLGLTGITLAAHDWGGAIGLGTVLALPQAFRRIVLFNTAAFPPPWIPWRIRLARLPLVGQWAVRGLNAFARAALWMATEKPERITPAVAGGLLAPYDSWDHRIAVQRFVEDIPTDPADRTWRVLADIEAGLPSLAAKPCLMIWGMRDWCFTPECLARLRQSLPSAEVEEYDDCGHYVVEDAHERIVPRLRRFLAVG